MEIKFKLNIEELATICHMENDIKGGYARTMKISTIGMCIYIFIRSIYLYNFDSIDGFIFEFTGMIIILLAFVGISRNPKFIRKKMVNLAKMSIKQTPKILDWQLIEIDDAYIEHTQLNSSTKTDLENIGKILSKDDVIFIFDNSECIFSAIPTSAFKTIEEKELFFKLLKKI
ncbi:MAG: hypothetical protein ACRCXA_09475 [Peptostreptococcaceae bacterium]